MAQGKWQFMTAFRDALKSQVPYWVLAFCLGALNIFAASQVVECLLMWVSLYIGLGAWIVFVKLKQSIAHSRSTFDFKSVGRNIYCAAWWPWYLYKSLGRRD